jgi:hypothetical protein
MEGKRIRVCSLTRNISKVKGVCWSSVMGIRMNDKQVNYSYGPTQIKQQVGKCII